MPQGSSGRRYQALEETQRSNYLNQSIITKKHAVKDPFYILDLGVVVELSKRWTQRLEKVKHFCTVKCNPGPACLGPTAALGSGINCACHGENEAVLALGISPDRITFAYPCKTKSHIKYGANVGVILTTIDLKEEIDKTCRWHPKHEPKVGGGEWRQKSEVRGGGRGTGCMCWPVGTTRETRD